MAYKVKKGDTLSQIAKSKGVTLQALLAANPNIKNANKIRVGQSIKMPDTKKMPGSKGGPYGRLSQTMMNMLGIGNKDDDKQSTVTTIIRKEVKDSGAQTSATPKKERAAKDKRSGRSEILKKAEQEKKRKQARKRPAVPGPDVAAAKGGMMKKTQMSKGGMANGKMHMYTGGGAVKDNLNPGLKALQKEAPEVVARMLKK
tara:strand:+ start:632 stop:1234 length:603 start_codon:yes stop_codon:yes gene_type:complete